MTSVQLKSAGISQIPDVDAVRQNLLEKVLQLSQSLLQKEEPNQIAYLINELKYEAVLYFTQKERPMLLNHHQAYHLHRQEHDQFIWKVSDLQVEINAGRFNQAIALCTDLKKWLDRYQATSAPKSFKFPFGKSRKKSGASL